MKRTRGKNEKRLYLKNAKRIVEFYLKDLVSSKFSDKNNSQAVNSCMLMLKAFESLFKVEIVGELILPCKILDNVLQAIPLFRESSEGVNPCFFINSFVLKEKASANVILVTKIHMRIFLIINVDEYYYKN